MKNQIEYFRIENGLSLEEVAKLSSTSNQQISRLEKGERRLSDIWLDRLSKVFDCYPSELLPLEWQKPSEAADKNVLSQAIEDMLEIKDSIEGEVDNQQLATLILLAYDKKIKENKKLTKADVQKIVIKTT